jgi:hypothetical protein
MQAGADRRDAGRQEGTHRLPGRRAPVGLHDTDEIERAVSAFARSPNGGLIVTAGAATVLHRNLIVTLAARHKLPRSTMNAHSPPPAA